MKTILVTGAGGSPSLNFIRSIRAAKQDVRIIGVDSNKYSLERAECDEKYLVPSARDADYIPLLNSILDETGATFLHAQNDTEIEILSRQRDVLHAKVFLPKPETVDICLDKYKTFQRWHSFVPQPKTVYLNKPSDLERAFAELGNPIWIRATRGAAGNGSLKVEDRATAEAWITFQKGWGNFVAAEYLSPVSITWQSIWYEGKLIVAQGRKRLYWEFANRAPSGITGLTGAGVTMRDAQLDDMALKAIQAVDDHPHGIFSVDLTYDKHGVPHPTEINIGRFFTTHEFFTRAGLNMPAMYLALALGETVEVKEEQRLNPLPPDLVWIRGLDFLPVLTTTQAIDAHESALAQRKRKLGLLGD